MLSAAGRSSIPVVRTIHSVDTRKHSLQAVVIFRRDRIELVMMTPRTMDGHAEKRVRHRGNHVVAIEVTCDFLVDRAVLNSHLRTLIPRSGRKHPECDHAIAAVGKQDITRNLFLHKTRIRFVTVK